MLRTPRLNLKVSAFIQLHGNFNFNNTHLASVGCKIIIHDRTDERPSWINHRPRGFYVGPVLPLFYRNYLCFMSGTEALRTSNIVDFPPTTCADPKMAATDRLLMIMLDLLSVLKSAPTSYPICNSHQQLAIAITSLQSILVIDGTSEQTTTPTTKPRHKPTTPIISNTI